MTKLLEWLSAAGIFFTVWYSLISGQIKHSLVHEYREFILFSPIIFIILFGLYAASIVLWRVFTFNNCEEAAVELKNQIEEAKKDLLKKGFKFDVASS